MEGFFEMVDFVYLVYLNQHVFVFEKMKVLASDSVGAAFHLEKNHKIMGYHLTRLLMS